MVEEDDPPRADWHGFSAEAVATARDALRRGRGMAQFHHPELGGLGQWSPGMVMIGSMSDLGLKARVDALFRYLAGGAETEPGGTPGADAWWPSTLGEPASTGDQDDLRYAHFPARHRLAVWQHGRVTVYETDGRSISGFGQQAGGSTAFSLSGPDGPVALDRLRVADDGQARPADGARNEEPRSAAEPLSGTGGGDPIAAIARLADLHRAGALTDAEFADKKRELLARVG